MEEQEEQQQERPRLSKKVESAVDSIQQAANNTGKTLTFNQAYSIFIRSKQLARDTAGVLSDAEKARQIDWCWKNKSRG